MKTVEIDGVCLTEEQVMQAYEKLQEPEFTYPTWFKHINSSLVIRFDALQSATCIIAGDGWKPGEVSTTCKPHTNERVWQQVDEPKLYERSRTGYTVFGDGSVAVSYNAERHFNNFNVYTTPELTEKASKLMKESNKLIMACLLVDPDYKPDWLEGSNKYSVYFDTLSGDYAPDYTRRYKGYAAHVSTREKAEEVAKRMTAWREL